MYLLHLLPAHRVDVKGNKRREDAEVAPAVVVKYVERPQRVRRGERAVLEHRAC